jgi:SPP1 family predicted phage head-tail adaptor
MRADMTSVITFWQNSKVKNAYGEYTDTYTLFNTAYASVEPLLGKEFLSSLSAQTKVELKFRTHYFEGLTNDMRIKFNNVDYEIISAVNVKNQNRELLIYAGKL